MLHKDFPSFQVSRWQGEEQSERQTGKGEGVRTLALEPESAAQGGPLPSPQLSLLLCEIKGLIKTTPELRAALPLDGSGFCNPNLLLFCYFLETRHPGCLSVSPPYTEGTEWRFSHLGVERF